MKRKILIIFFILALALCLTFVCSASEYDFLASGEYSSLIDNNVGDVVSYKISYLGSNNANANLSMLILDGQGMPSQGKSIFFIQPKGFQQFVDLVTNHNGDCSYIEFKNFCGDAVVVSSSVLENYFYAQWWNSESTLTEAYYNKLYHYNDDLTYSEGYVEGITEGIKQAHQFTYDYLEEYDILNEPIAATGRLDSLEMLLADNVLAEIEAARTDTVDAALNKLEAWLRSKSLTVKDYNRDNTVDAIDRLIETNLNSACAEFIKEGRSDAILRLSAWLNDNDLKSNLVENNGLLSDVDAALDSNIIPALKKQYNIGKTDGKAIGETTSDSLRQGIFAIFSAPVDMMARILNFELFGINLFYLISGLLTLSLAAWVIKKFLVR